MCENIRVPPPAPPPPPPPGDARCLCDSQSSEVARPKETILKGRLDLLSPCII